jgi:pimeloyl-ACP methyl ester carboxylesterase
VEHGRRLAAGLRASTLRILPGDGHVPTISRPAEVAALIEAAFA